MHITTQEFSERRDRLLAQMGEGSLALIPGAGLVFRNSDSHYPFRQDSDFYYLTGFQEPNAALILLKESSKRAQTLLFCAEKKPEEELWTGIRLGVEGAKASLGIDEAYAISELPVKMAAYLQQIKTIYYGWGSHPTLEAQLRVWIQEARQKARKSALYPTEYLDLGMLLHELRLFKSPAELACIQKAVDVSVYAHQQVMARSKPGLKEYQLEATFIHALRESGLRETAYSTIVGGGANACVLHYVDNQATLQDHQLVLIDAGAEYSCYAADITRTFPINGCFTGPQRDLYQVVLEAQAAGIQAAQPGNRWGEIQQAVVRVIVQGLMDLNILGGACLETLIEQEAYKPFYMHGSGHWLGLDVHDVGAYRKEGQGRVLEPQMVLTVEPGLYIRASEAVPAVFHDMGIRIEDDVVIREEGPEVLSGALAKSLEAIEAGM